MIFRNQIAKTREVKVTTSTNKKATQDDLGKAVKNIVTDFNFNGFGGDDRLRVSYLRH